MYKIATLAMLIGGTALVICGLSAEQSFISSVSKLLTGSPTDKAIWLLIAGVVLTFLGLVAFFRRPKATA